MEYLNGNAQPSKSLTVVRPSGELAPAQYAEIVNPYYVQEGSDTGREYARVLLRHKGKLCLFALGGIMLGIAIGIPQTPTYRVRTALEVLSLNQDFMNTKQTSPVATNDDSYETSEEETQVQLLQSDALLDRVINKFDPGLVYIRHNPRMATSGWRGTLHLPEHLALNDRQNLIVALADSLKVQSTPRTRVIELSAKSSDPQLATDFANTLANEFIAQSIEARLKTTEKIGDWLGHELDDARKRLQQSESALQEYAGKSGLIFTSTSDNQDTNIATEKLQQLQQQLTTLSTDRVAKEARFELAQHSPPDSLPDVLGDDGLQQTHASLVEARQKLADLSAVFTPDFVKVKQATAAIAVLQGAFEDQRAAIVDRIKNDYTEAMRKEGLLAASYDAQAREVMGQDEKAVQYNILKREADSNRQLYDTMLQQLKQSSIASALHASNVRVVDPATLPQRLIWPNYKILAPLGLLFGLMVGLVAVVTIERMDRSLRQPGEIQLWTNMPELGTIPSASVDAGRKVRIKLLKDSSGDAGSRLLGDDKKMGKSVELITWHRKPSLMAEAFRAALTSILFVGENGSRPRVVVLTSANAADGKTTVSTNLAIAMAEVRGKVLVIDGDLRRPRLHQLFGIENDRGLADPAERNLLWKMRRSPKTFARQAYPGLNVLTSGTPTLTAANLLHSPNLAELFVRLKQQYDMILVDTPPMLQIADARLLGRCADAVVLVARAGHTTRDAILGRPISDFREDRIHVLGHNSNDWDLQAIAQDTTVTK